MKTNAFSHPSILLLIGSVSLDKRFTLQINDVCTAEVFVDDHGGVECELKKSNYKLRLTCDTVE